MKVTLVTCGPAANQSELKAFEYLKSRLISEPGDDNWILLTNLAFSVTHELQSDEIDLIAVGPTGVRVVEIKHWTTQWVSRNRPIVEAAAERVTSKARKVGTTLRRIVPDLPHVDGAILITQDASRAKTISGRAARGVKIYTLNDWKAAINVDAQQVLSSADINRLATELHPPSQVAIDGSLRRLAGYVNLELQSRKEERFHRIYSGSHPARRDRVVLHLYDLSASDDSNAETKAKREFDTLHRLQLYPWAPRILDSYQEAPGYEGELYFFTLVDPAAPSIAERATDDNWKTTDRLGFARNAICALAEFHDAGEGDEHLVHRNLTPWTLLVRHDNTPLLTGFELTKIPSETSVASSSLPSGERPPWMAPEVQRMGWGAAGPRSDIYSLCFSLSVLFEGRIDPLSQETLAVLARGLTTEPAQRIKLAELETLFSELLGESLPPPAPPPARFWTEDQEIPFRENQYRIVSRLGSGGVGTTYKVVELDRSTGEELGTYVAKVAHNREIGQQVLKAYKQVRPHLRHTALSTIFEVAREWQENEFIALMTWVSGTPLGEFEGVFPLLAEEQQESSPEALATRWLRLIISGLDLLHQSGLIHGDVSPRNLIVSGTDLVLTDYDFVCRIGERARAPGTVAYCSPSYDEGKPASPADDIYALAASFFHVIFEKEPFRYDGELEKTRGLNWEGVDRRGYPLLVRFLNQATHPDPEQRFANASQALAALATPEEQLETSALDEAELEKLQNNAVREEVISVTLPLELREQRLEWLRQLLQTYPGSPWGNQETRGLDTKFASQTYVETPLEETLLRDITQRHVRLVILCGNAGDGKTALLQHLAARLGLGTHPSVKRVLEGKVVDGPFVRINLDGSASWQGRSADELLDEFLEPFQNGKPVEDIVHLLAINDGRLLEWIEGVEARLGGKATPLTESLYDLLQQEADTQVEHIRFINLNQRSLVGGITPGNTIETSFLERLLDRLYGGEQAPEIWSLCRSCVAQEHCQVFRAARVFGPETIPSPVAPEVRERARQRLFEALQAVHLSGETHITMRELRASLVYVLFGVHFCDDYHNGSEVEVLPYWDRAFQANSPARQGEVLTELIRFDPSLEAHPQIDRHLLSPPSGDSTHTAPHYSDLTLPSARRRAYFEWTEEAVEEVAGDRSALGLARGEHLQLFRELPLYDEVRLAEVCERLCRGISRLEDLPPQALDRPGVVPLRVTPRTPTETALWVEKPLIAFRLEADVPPHTEGVEQLHRQAHLIYCYRDGFREERLRLGAELFHLLLELAEGYQLGDVSTDDTFALLSIFVQRLVREDERELLAWNPMQDETIYRVTADIRETATGPRQQMIISPLEPGVEK